MANNVSAGTGRIVVTRIGLKSLQVNMRAELPDGTLGDLAFVVRDDDPRFEFFEQKVSK